MQCNAMQCNAMQCNVRQAWSIGTTLGAQDGILSIKWYTKYTKRHWYTKYTKIQWHAKYTRRQAMQGIQDKLAASIQPLVHRTE